MESLEESLKFRQWKASLVHHQIEVQKITPLHLVHKPNGELLFALVNIQGKAPNGESVLPVAMLRGYFVMVVTVLIEQETQQKYLLLVGQRRIANGALFYEHPAGMCDSETDPYEVALKEVKEETTLSVSREELVPLSDQLLYSSPGLLDEGGYFFYCEKKLSSTEIAAFQGKKTGAEGEREHIQTQVVPIEKAMEKMTNALARLSLYMYLDTAGKKV